MTSKIIHFEDLWVMSEKVAEKRYNTDPLKSSIVPEIKELIEELSKIQGNSSLITLELKKKKIGEILFLLTAYSIKENIDVYAALKGEKEMVELELTNTDHPFQEIETILDQIKPI